MTSRYTIGFNNIEPCGVPSTLFFHKKKRSTVAKKKNKNRKFEGSGWLVASGVLILLLVIFGALVF